jgi:aspartyl-tRNA(Asn)/glutamyl-tRNA(Gln) amidotransferase subunit A
VDATDRAARSCGAVLAAKLAMVELAGGGYRYPSASLQGPGRNPWNTERWSGGSSSGSAAAGRRQSPRTRSARRLGLHRHAVRVRRHRTSSDVRPRVVTARWRSWTLDKIDRWRTADDVALILEAIAGPDANDATSSDGASSPRLARGPCGREGRRVAFADEDIEDHPSPEAKQALAEASPSSGGSPCVRARRCRRSPYGPMVGTVYGAEGATIRRAHRRGPVRGAGRRTPEGGCAPRSTSRLVITCRQCACVRLSEAFREIFHEADVILSVGRSTITATPITQALDSPPTTASNPQPSRRPGNIGLIPAGNLAGVPALFFPCGFGTDGLPVGLQLVGPPFSEPLLLAIASAYQRETGHHLKRPPV